MVSVKVALHYDVTHLCLYIVKESENDLGFASLCYKIANAKKVFFFLLLQNPPTHRRPTYLNQQVELEAI